jgi:hypothetical protein
MTLSLGATKSFSHGDHGMPGALPPPPHGGTVQEAEHSGADAHAEGGEETELFFEVTYKNKEVAVYPLTLGGEKKNIFAPLSPKSLSKIELKAEHPRQKKLETLVSKVADDAIRAPFDSKNANRFIVHVGAEYEKEMKTAKVQIERK